ncbi:hypothetical protein CEUSTIGMA_g11998.t1 [Chlamydomonas eustigma]|uniref:mRNA guanylyltransferase n=1 Tax=Chlamydomonas eustigma TaxID=1157962 RepID=A0A250XNC7_9CHLO|nr:hypothetical protein CEUSTIGMA_g11998.t1 [Chlamydomonas eustigma]|eukprot:GAX84577.1 hypothetical protein CEUSTIGMA_g11998.t1 [Chlamydomonas eustigma]
MYTHRQLELPPGWVDCPCFGSPPSVSGRVLNVIPSKVPLSYDYAQLIPRGKMYTLRDALAMLEKQNMNVGMVLDLTNSSRYYNFASEVPNAEQRGMFYRKVPCRGRGQTPPPAAVNQAVWEIFTFLEYFPQRYVLVHCTHGFNRTGFIITCALTRLFESSVERSIKNFAEGRPPGIYKDAYVEELFRYHHERRSKSKIPTPPVPTWKSHDGRDDDEDAGEDTVSENMPSSEGSLRSHDKIFEIGEQILPEEADFILQTVSKVILPERPDIKFPGSQPVSLDRQNLARIWGNRYWVTWKADGTRYMMLIERRGCYLIDRAANVARVQMRFPTASKPTNPSVRPFYPVGRPHHLTLLDGEMVVDHDKESNTYTRRFLVYDMMAVCDRALVTEPFVNRYSQIETLLIQPRKAEMQYIAEPHCTLKPGQVLKPGQTRPLKYETYPLEYQYRNEPFSIRRKEFHPLHQAQKLITKLIPQLCHEADGLILQPADDCYKALTTQELLKWKFSHLNSVDFKLRCVTNAQGELVENQLLLMERSSGRRGGHYENHQQTHYRAVEGVGVHFPEDMKPMLLHDRIIECTWSNELNMWSFLRVREDKTEPNAAHVYAKVVDSIRDNIGEEELLSYLVKCFLLGDAYEADRRHVPPGQMPAMPEDAPTMEPEAENEENGVPGSSSWEAQNDDEDHEHAASYQGLDPVDKSWGDDVGEGQGQGHKPETTTEVSNDPLTREGGMYSQSDRSVEGRRDPAIRQRGSAGQQPAGRSDWRRGPEASNYRKGFLTGSEAHRVPRAPYDPMEPDSRIFDMGTMPLSPVWVFHHEEGLDGPVRDIAALVAEEQAMISCRDGAKCVSSPGPSRADESGHQEGQDADLRAKRPRIHDSSVAHSAPPSLHNKISFPTLPTDPFYFADEPK